MSISGHRRLTIADAIAVAKRGRKLLRAGKITAKAYVVLDCLLWSCRNPTTGAIVVSYTALCRLCHCARGTVAASLEAMERLGVLTRIKRRIRVAWAQGGVASRQLTSAYCLHPGADTEFSGQPVSHITIVRQEAREGLFGAGQGAVDLLLRRRMVMEGRLAAGIGAGVGQAR